MAESETEHASLPRNMAQMHPFIAIRYLGHSLAAAWDGRTSSAYSSTAFHHRGGGPDPVRHPKRAGPLEKKVADRGGDE
jgi:hypothetical protein